MLLVDQHRGGETRRTRLTAVVENRRQGRTLVENVVDDHPWRPAMGISGETRQNSSPPRMPPR